MWLEHNRLLTFVLGYFSYIIRPLYYIKREDIDKIKDQKPNEHQFVSALKEVCRKQKQIFVPKYAHSVRVKVTSDEEFERCRESCAVVRHNDRELLIGEESANMDSTCGICVFSAIKDQPKAKEIRVSYRFCKLLHQVYGYGYNQRASVPSMCFNSYRGKRLTSRPGASPTVALEHVGEQQYKTERHSFPLCQAITEKVCNSLVKNAEIIAKHLNPGLMEVVGDSCKKSIMTCGGPTSCLTEDGLVRIRPRALSTSLHGFCNVSHVDCLDSVGNLKDDLSVRAKSEYGRRVVQWSGFCMPTTCVYQHVWNTPFGVRPREANLEQMFLLDEIGIGFQLEDNFAISFLGDATSHFTSVAFVLWNNGEVSLGNSDNDLGVVFAWGRTGGRKECADSLGANE